jgi:hypothetical protein
MCSQDDMGPISDLLNISAPILIPLAMKSNPSMVCAALQPWIQQQLLFSPILYSSVLWTSGPNTGGYQDYSLLACDTA